MTNEISENFRMRVFRLTKTVACEGVGLHTGQRAKLTISPSRQPGIFFHKHASKRIIPVALDHVVETNRGVSLRDGQETIKTVEHLLAAIRWVGIRDLEIALEGEEIPILDGSALPWVELFKPYLEETEEEFPRFELDRPLSVREGDSLVTAVPADRLTVSYRIDYPGTPVGSQTWSGEIASESFERELAPARTFGFLEEVEALRKGGLAQGGNLENCVVITQSAFLTPLRFQDEPIRHKVLDFLGDMALLGFIPVARMEAIRAGHRLHIALAKAMQEVRQRGKKGESGSSNKKKSGKIQKRSFPTVLHFCF